jgi:hypothetical protein
MIKGLIAGCGEIATAAHGLRGAQPDAVEEMVAKRHIGPQKALDVIRATT